MVEEEWLLQEDSKKEEYKPTCMFIVQTISTDHVSKTKMIEKQNKSPFCF